MTIFVISADSKKNRSKSVLTNPQNAKKIFKTFIIIYNYFAGKLYNFYFTRSLVIFCRPNWSREPEVK